MPQILSPHSAPRDANHALRGAALYLILLVVVLYAALTISVIRQSGLSSVTSFRETQSIEIAQVQQMLVGVSNEFNRLVLGGCDPASIYTFPVSPADMATAGASTSIKNSKCVIYNSVGGNLPPFFPQTDFDRFLNMTPDASRPFYGYFSQPLLVNFPGIGSSKPDIAFTYPLGIVGTSSLQTQSLIDTCNRINEQMQIPFTITLANYSSFSTWLGLYLNDVTTTLPDFLGAITVPAAFNGKETGCLVSQSNYFIMYHIAVER